MTVPVSFHIIWRDHERVNSSANAMHAPIDSAHQIKSISSLFYDEQVEVAIACHFAARSGTEEEDLFRFGYFDDTPDNLGQDILIMHTQLLVGLRLANWTGYSCQHGARYTNLTRQ